MSRTRRKLTARLDSIEREREALLGRLVDLPRHRLEARPDSDTWSVLQIVEHLVQAEEWVLLARLDADQLEARPRSLANRLWYRIVLLVLRGPFPVKTPTRQMNPTGDASLEELGDRWRRSHTRLRRISTAAERPTRDALFRHPVAGPLTPMQAIEMLRTHQRRHLKQIRRRLAGTTPSAPR